MEIRKNRLCIDTEGITIALNDNKTDIAAWIRDHQSCASFKSTPGTITRKVLNENTKKTVTEERACIVHVIKNLEMDSYRLWILYSDSTSENFEVPARTVSKKRLAEAAKIARAQQALQGKMAALGSNA